MSIPKFCSRLSTLHTPCLTSPPSTSRGRHLLPTSNPVGQQVDWCSGTEMTESPTPCQDPHPSFSAPQASRQGLMLQELTVSSGHCCGQPALSSLPVSSQRKMYLECSNIRRSTSPNSRWSGWLQGTWCEAWWKRGGLDFVLGLLLLKEHKGQKVERNMPLHS